MSYSKLTAEKLVRENAEELGNLKFAKQAEARKNIPRTDYSFEFVDSSGGEGQGESYWCVYRDQEGTLWRASAWYSSWEGVDWSFVTVEEVVARPITVVEYRPVLDV
jgi:hypothetical protein